MKDINKIIWPTRRRFFSIWHDYFREALLALGLKIEISEGLWEGYPDIHGVLPFDVIWKSGEKQRIWYDISDFVKHYYEMVMGGNDLYLKIQLHKKDQHYQRIYPVGQITCKLNFPQELPSFRAIQQRQDFIYDVIGIFRDTDHGKRRKAVEIVKSERWKSLVGVAWFRNRVPISKEFVHKKLIYEEHLKLQCRSKICLDFPGVGGDWTWRSVETLGMGCFCLRAKSDQVLFENHNKCWGEVNPDLSDLAEKIDYYLNNEAEREQIAKNGLRYYENHLSLKAQAKYFLRILSENQ